MAKQKFDLASKLRSLIEAEKNRRNGDRAKLLREQKRLLKALAKVEEALAKQETQLAEELTRAAADAGVAIVGIEAEPTTPGTKVAAKKKRRARGSNINWIAQKIASGYTTRLELCKAAIKEGMSAASISQSLASLTQKGHVVKKGQRCNAVYTLPATPEAEAPKKTVKKAAKKPVKKTVKKATKKVAKKKTVKKTVKKVAEK